MVPIHIGIGRPVLPPRDRLLKQFPEFGYINVTGVHKVRRRRKEGDIAWPALVKCHSIRKMATLTIKVKIDSAVDDHGLVASDGRVTAVAMMS
ncbi:MAG: hypothetical protein WBV06_08255 [Acidimicrobiia bacterium]